jgi:hypothetical protein
LIEQKSNLLAEDVTGLNPVIRAIQNENIPLLEQICAKLNDFDFITQSGEHIWTVAARTGKTHYF